MRKLQVDINTLTTALQIANKVICKKALMITGNFKFDVVNNKLTITTTDLENFITTTIDCASENSFSFLLPVSELRLIEKLDSGILTITLNDDDNTIALFTSDENINVAIDNVDYYPSMPSSKILKVGNFKNDFITEIKSCLNFIGTDDLRPNMRGINFQIENGEVELCATDAHTMKLVRIEGEQLTDAASLTFIINNKQCKILTSFKKLKDIELNEEKSINKQGQILEIKNDFIIVGCEKGSLKIKTLQAPSKKAMNSVDFIRGQRLEISSILI
jgi:DNA polymerase III sliding clamp (beta) subunit (PCNA family)